MKASDFIARYVEARGVTHCFELVGGMITHLLDSLASTDVNIVSCHHEQAAGFAAEGAARVSGIPGVALATSGPGATNLLTAIGSCYFDSIPAVFITGQVNTHELRGDSGVRQLGFQETDIVAMATPICKSAVQARAGSELPELLKHAFDYAVDGRQGPCLLDIPMNVQSQSIDSSVTSEYIRLASLVSSQINVSERVQNDSAIITQLRCLLESLCSAERPLLLLGGGCAAHPNRSAARKIVEMLNLPAVMSLMAVDIIPFDDHRRVGFIGSYGNRWANKVLGESDVLVVIGSRLDIRQTGADVASFVAGKEIWQIDIDSAEMGLRVKTQHALHISVDAFSDLLSCLISQESDLSSSPERYTDWFRRIEFLKSQYPVELEYQSEEKQINPYQVLAKLNHLLSAPTLYVTDVGQHQMWSAQGLRFRDRDRWLTSGGMGAMGFGLPAAIGASLTNPECATVLISGDGSLQLNIQEFETVRRNNLNLKILVFNNHCHGMVRQFQETYFGGNTQSTVTGYTAPSFVAVAQAYQIPAWSALNPSKLDDLLKVWISTDGPALLEVALAQSSKVYPKLAFGRSFGEMEPEVEPIAMEST